MHQRGYTSVELMIVVTILSIAAVAALPMLGETSSTRLSAAARLLMADIDFARIKSIGRSSNDRCVIVLDQANNLYRIALASDPATPITNIVGNEPYEVQFGVGRAAELSGVP